MPKIKLLNFFLYWITKIALTSLLYAFFGGQDLEGNFMVGMITLFSTTISTVCILTLFWLFEVFLFTKRTFLPWLFLIILLALNVIILYKQPFFSRKESITYTICDTTSLLLIGYLFLIRPIQKQRKIYLSSNLFPR